MKDKIEKFIKYLTTITKAEADFIESIINWNDETKIAFMMAKQIFEEKNE